MIVSFKAKSNKATITIKNNCVKLPVSYTQDIFGVRKMKEIDVRVPRNARI